MCDNARNIFLLDEWTPVVAYFRFCTCLLFESWLSVLTFSQRIGNYMMNDPDILLCQVEFLCSHQVGPSDLRFPVESFKPRHAKRQNPWVCCSSHMCATSFHVWLSFPLCVGTLLGLPSLAGVPKVKIMQNFMVVRRELKSSLQKVTIRLVIMDQ